MNKVTAALSTILAAFALTDGRVREWWFAQSDYAKVLYGCLFVSLAIIIGLYSAGFLNY